MQLLLIRLLGMELEELRHLDMSELLLQAGEIDGMKHRVQKEKHQDMELAGQKLLEQIEAMLKKKLFLRPPLHRQVSDALDGMKLLVQHLVQLQVEA
jgi:hypothetical protein